MTNYVLGFLFRDNCTSVVLIRKNKPKWQAGLLNGIGGKIEGKESPYDAIVREFKEEAGVDTSKSGWREFAEMSGQDFRVFCLTARDSAAWQFVETKEEEVIELHHPDRLVDEDCVSNLHWLIELALDENHGKPVYATIRYSPPFRFGV